MTALRKVEQSAFWTCGLACVAMALGWQSDAKLRAQHEALAGGPTVPWTVELLRYLCALLPPGQQAHMLTTSAGIGTAMAADTATAPSLYANMSRSELARIAALYRTERSRITIADCGADLTAAARFRPHCCIFLVDARYLRGACRRCGGGAVLTAHVSPSGYSGHFVFVTKIAAGEVRFIDPAPDPDRRRCSLECAVSRSQFDTARTAPGTDQDCICIFRNRETTRRRCQSE